LDPDGGVQGIQKFSANTTVWLFVRNPDTLDALEPKAASAFRQACPTLSRAYDLIREFLSMVHHREGAR